VAVVVVINGAVELKAQPHHRRHHYQLSGLGAILSLQLAIDRSILIYYFTKKLYSNIYWCGCFEYCGARTGISVFPSSLQNRRHAGTNGTRSAQLPVTFAIKSAALA
jgi:hypothetical protein